MQTEVTLDSLLTANTIDENKLPEALLTESELERELWRLKQNLQIFTLQDLQRKEDVKPTDLPIFSSLIKQVAVIAGNKDKIMTHYSCYPFLYSSSQLSVIRELVSDMKRLLEALIKFEQSDDLLCNSLIVMQVFGYCYHGQPSKLLSPQQNVHFFKSILDRNNLELTAAALDFFELQHPSSDSNQVRVLEKMIESFVCFPIQKSNQTSFFTALKMVDQFNFELRPTIEPAPHSGFSCQQMRDDQRKASELAEDFIGKKLIEKMSSVEFKAYLNAYIHVIIARQIQDSALHFNLRIVFLRSLNFILRSTSQEPNQIMDDKSFLKELIQYLQEVESPQIASELIAIMALRLTRSKTRDQDIAFYLAEIESADEAPTADNLVLEESSILKMMQQIFSIELHRRDQEDVEMSAFDDQYPLTQYQRLVGKGFLKQTVANNNDVQLALMQLIRIFKVSTKRFNSQDRQIHIKAILKKITDVELKSVSSPASCSKYTLNQILILCSCFNGESVFDPDNPSFITIFQDAVKAWIESFNQEVQVFDEDKGLLRDLSQLEKGRIVAELINSLSDDKPDFSMQRIVLPQDFGARVSDSRLLKIFEADILAKYVDQIWSDSALDIILIAYVNLIGTMINNEPNLVSVLLKPAEEDPSIINKLLAAISKQAPRTQTYHHFYSDAFESICLKFFARLAITENGKKAVHDHGKEVVEQLLQARKESQEVGYFMGQPKKLRGYIARDQNYDNILQIKPLVITIRENFKQHLLELLKQTKSVESKINDLFNMQNKNAQNAVKFEFIVKAFFYTQSKEAQALENAMMMISIQGKRPNYSRNPTTFLIQLIKETGTDKCCLDQYEGILDTMESLSMIAKGHCSQMMELVKVIIEDSHELGHQDQIEIKCVVGRMKKVQQSFLQFMEDSQVKTLDELSALPQFEKLIEPVTMYDQLVLVRLNQQFVNKIGVFNEWKDQIPSLVKLSAMIIQKQSELLDQALRGNITASNFKLNPSLLKKLKDINLTDDVASFIPWFEKSEKILAKVQKYQAKNFKLSTRSESFPFEFLKIMQITATQRHQRVVQSNSAQQVASNNLCAIADQLVILSHQLQTDEAEDFDAQIVHNSNILVTFMSLLGGSESIQGAMHVRFIQKSGIRPLCKIYKQLQRWQKKLFLNNIDERDRTLEKARILIQREMVGKILTGLLKVTRRYEQTYVVLDVKKLTDNQFENLSQLFMHQYNQAFEEILSWHNPSTYEDGRSQILKERTPNFDLVIETLVQAFADKSWSIFEGSESDRNNGQPRRRQNQQPQPDREVTQAELERVTALGFDPETSRHAIRMANFSTEGAVNILLGNEIGLLQFIESENLRKKQEEERKQSEELQRVMTKVLNKLPSEQDSEVITKEEFEKRFEAYKICLTVGVLNVTNTSQIDCAKALTILKKLSTNLPKGQLLELASKSLIEDESDVLKKSLFLRVILMEMQDQIGDKGLPSVDQLIKFGFQLIEKRQASQQSEEDFKTKETVRETVIQSLYYIGIYLLKRSEVANIGSEVVYDYLAKLIASNVDELVEEIACMTIYQIIAKQKPEQAQKVAANFVKDFKLERSTDKAIYTEIEKWALYTQLAMENVASEHINTVFLANLLHNTKVLTEEKKELPPIAELAKLSYKDALAELQLILREQSDIKQVLQKTCKIVKQQAQASPYCVPSEAQITELFTKFEHTKLKIAETRKKTTMDDAEFESSCSVLVSSVDDTLKQNFSAILGAFLKEIDYSDHEISLKALKKFSKLAELMRVNKSLLPLLITGIDEGTKFEDWFIRKLCASCLVDTQVTILNGLDLDDKSLNTQKGKGFTKIDCPGFGKLIQPSSFNEDLNRVLAPLLGTSVISTDSNEFNLKHNLKLRLIKTAVSIIEEENSGSKIEHQAQIQAALQVIRTLITSKNPYEFNRVLRQNSDFWDCIEYLVLQTNFIAIIEKIFARDMPAYESKNNDESKNANFFIDSAIECLLVVIEYIDLKKVIVKQEKKDRKVRQAETSAQKAKEPDVEMVDQQHVEVRQPPEPLVEVQPVEQVEGSSEESVAEEDEGDNDSDEDPDEDHDEDPDEDPNEDPDDEGNDQPEDQEGSDEYYDEDEDDENLEGQNAHRPQAQRNDILIPARDQAQPHRSRFELHEFHSRLEYVPRAARMAQAENQFDDQWTEQEQQVRQLIQQISRRPDNQVIGHNDDESNSRHSPRRIDRELLPTKAQILQMQGDFKFNNYSQKFDILKPMSLSYDLVRALAQNYKSFEKDHEKSQREPVRFQQKSERQSLGGIFVRHQDMMRMEDQDQPRDRESIQEHLRRVEMHMAMMMRMNRELDDEDPRFMDEMFGFERFFGERRREEEVKVDLLGINQPNRALQYAPDNNLHLGSSLAIGEQILQQLNEEGLVETIIDAASDQQENQTFLGHRSSQSLVQTTPPLSPRTAIRQASQPGHQEIMQSQNVEGISNNQPPPLNINSAPFDPNQMPQPNLIATNVLNELHQALDQLPQPNLIAPEMHNSLNQVLDQARLQLEQIHHEIEQAAVEQNIPEVLQLPLPVANQDQIMAEQPEIQQISESEIPAQQVSNVVMESFDASNDNVAADNQIIPPADQINVEHQVNVEPQPLQADVLIVDQQQLVQQEPHTFGYPNSVLIANDIDPEILNDLPEDVRVELLSTINWQPPQVIQAQPAQEINQNDANHAEVVQLEPAVPEEEAKEDFGIDQEFLANLPEDVRQEILQNQGLLNRNLGRNNQPPAQLQRQAEEMDISSLIATVQDPVLRNEMILSLGEEQLAQLPPNLRAEADQARQAQAEQRRRQQREVQMMMEHRERFGANQNRFPPNFPHPNPPNVFGGPIRFDRFGIGRAPHGLFEEFGRMNEVRDGQINDGGSGRQNDRSRQLSPSQVIFNLQCGKKDDVLEGENNLVQLESKVANASTLVSSLYGLLQRISLEFEPVATNSANRHRFQLVPFLNALMTIRTPQGTFNNQQTALSLVQNGLLEKCSQISQVGEKSKQFLASILLQVGILRLIVRNNSKCGVFLIREFLFNKNTEAEEGQISTVSSQSLVKIILNELKNLQKTQSQSESGLKENSIRALQRNLQQSLTDIFGEFDKAFEKSFLHKNGQNVSISEETVHSVTSVLDFSIADQQLVQSVGQALLTLSKIKPENWSLIFEVCSKKLTHLQSAVTRSLMKLLPRQKNGVEEDDDMLMPSEELSLNYSLSQMSANQEKEEPKQQAPKLAISKSEISKMDSTLKQSKSEIASLVHIFEIFSLFRKTSEKSQQMEADLAKQQISSESKSHLNGLNEVLKHIQQNTKILKNSELLQSLRLHVSCIFDTYLSELIDSKKKKPDSQSSDISIRMKPLTVSQSAQVNNQQKVAWAVYGDSELTSVSLFEFGKFCLNNKEILNQLLTLQSGQESLSLNVPNLAVHMPNVLNFENKRAYFRKELEKISRNSHHRQRLSIHIKRNNIFTEAFAQLGHKSPSDLLGSLHVDFTGERGADAGGLTRDFFIELSRAMFNPNYSLFNLTSNGVTYYPNSQSFVNPDHLNFFKFIGRMIGKALFDGHLLECYFSKPLYKMMVGQDITFEDQQDLDNDYFRSCRWGIENKIDDQELYFTVTTDYFGRIEEKELIPGGQNVKVNDENKIDYFEKMGYFRMYESIKQQIDSFLQGFHELIPKNLARIFSPSEMELLISGLPNFDLADLRANTEFTNGYTPESPQVRWLWQTLAAATKEDIGRFLQFVTGSSKIPLEGFKALQGMRGPQKFQITRIRDISRLPAGHTCFNQFDLPEYPTFEMLNEKVLYAIKETVGFGFA